VSEANAVRQANGAWRFKPFDGHDMPLLVDPSLTSARATDVLRADELLLVSEERIDADGVRYLKLADGRGWVYSNLPNQGTMCEREALPEDMAEAAELRGLLSSMTGSSLLASKLARRLEHISERQENCDRATLQATQEAQQLATKSKGLQDVERRVTDVWIDVQRLVDGHFPAATTHCLSCGVLSAAPNRLGAATPPWSWTEDRGDESESNRPYGGAPRPSSARKVERPASARTASTAASTPGQATFPAPVTWTHVHGSEPPSAAPSRPSSATARPNAHLAAAGASGSALGAVRAQSVAAGPALPKRRPASARRLVETAKS